MLRYMLRYMLRHTKWVVGTTYEVGSWYDIRSGLWLRHVTI